MRFSKKLDYLKPFSKASAFIRVFGSYSFDDRRKRLKTCALLLKKRISVFETLIYLLPSSPIGEISHKLLIS